MNIRDKQFRELMKSFQQERAPQDITGKVMERIYAATPVVSDFSPVAYNKWGIRIAFLLFCLFIGYASFSPSLDGMQNNKIENFIHQHPAIDLSGVVNPFLHFFNQLPLELFFAIFAALLLLFINWLFMQVHAVAQNR